MSNTINAIGNDLKLDISRTLNEWLEYQNGIKLRFIASEFNIDIMTNDIYDYVSYIDAILLHCNDNLGNSINILQFINNGYK